jgi:GR25 family glycosyltransferase involved in LPS biosynthesis
MNINEYFDKIYCINMSKRADRWEAVTKRFEAVGLTNVYRWEALDGDVLEVLLGGELSKRNYVASTISHLMAINHAKYNNYERVLILEDDVCPHKDLQKMFDDFYEKQSKLAWDIFYFGFIPITDDGQTWAYRLIDDCSADKNIVKAKCYASGSHAYALQK